jgi:hypothetical protein
VLRLLRLPYVVALVALHLSSALLAAPLQLYLLVLQVRPNHTCATPYSPLLLLLRVEQTTMGPQVLARSRVLHALLWLPRYRLAGPQLTCFVRRLTVWWCWRLWADGSAARSSPCSLWG